MTVAKNSNLPSMALDYCRRVWSDMKAGRRHTTHASLAEGWAPRVSSPRRHAAILGCANIDALILSGFKPARYRRLDQHKVWCSQGRGSE